MDCEICDKKIVPGEKSGLLTREIRDTELMRFSLIPPPARWAGGKWRDSYIHHSCFLDFKERQLRFVRGLGMSQTLTSSEFIQLSSDT